MLGRASLVAVALFVVAGCNAGLHGFGVGTAPPRPPTRPPTPAASVAPIATTPSSVQPVPVSSVAPSPSGATETQPVSLNGFRKHMIRTGREMKRPFKQMLRAAEAEDVQAIIKAISKARSWAEKEHAWIEAHAPAACFSALYEVWREAIAHISEGLTVMHGALDPINEAELMRGLRLLEEAEQVVDEHVESRTDLPCTRTPDGAHG